MNLIIDSILTGTPKPLARGKESAIAKFPVNGTVAAGPLGLAGDAQADLKVHGGPDKAIHIYPRDHYTLWQTELSSPQAADLLQKAGAFGENLSVRSIAEDGTCIGDTWRAGSAILQVSQGRQPCWKLNERFAISDMSARVQTSGRTGWYFRVLQPGNIRAGDALQLLDRPHPQWSVARIARIFYHDGINPEALSAIAALPELAGSWRNLILRRLESRQIENWSRRLTGE